MELQFIASKVVEMDRKIKKLQDQFAAEKVKLIAAMIEENVSSIEIKRATVTLCKRQNKDFGADIAAQELAIKAEKKKLETLGMFTISSVTNFIQIRWHLGRQFRLPFIHLSPYTFTDLWLFTSPLAARMTFISPISVNFKTLSSISVIQTAILRWHFPPGE